MIFNNIIISLENVKSNNYKIFFVTETYNIIFPRSLEDKFIHATNNLCEYNIEDFLICKNLFNNNNYIPITFINENMNITAEIDSIIRFSKNKDEYKKYKTRIKFENIDYFILPLIMFKNFHVQFDGESNKINFYTTDESILKLKKVKENENVEEPNNEGISTILLVLILIISILLILIIGFVIYIY